MKLWTKLLDLFRRKPTPMPENWPLVFPPGRTTCTWRELAEYNQQLRSGNGPDDGYGDGNG